MSETVAQSGEKAASGHGQAVREAASTKGKAKKRKKQMHKSSISKTRRRERRMKKKEASEELANSLLDEREKAEKVGQAVSERVAVSEKESEKVKRCAKDWPPTKRARI